MKNVKSLTIWELDLPDVLHVAHKHRTNLFGYDPGTIHFGIAWTNLNRVMLAQAELERAKDSVQRMNDLSAVLVALSLSMSWSLPHAVHVIEGASYSDKFRQVELAEARTTIKWWTDRMKPGSCHILQPNTIRKQVFQNAVMMAHNYWDADDINYDALAALSCLYYAKFLVENENGKW